MSGPRYAIGPNGRPVLQTEEQAEDTAGQGLGYTQIAKGEYEGQKTAAKASDYVDQHWGTGGKALAGAASGLTLGLGPSIASRMGLVDQDNLEAAEQSGAYVAGDVAGMVAPALLSGGGSLAARGAAQGGARGLGKIALALTPAGLMGEAGGLAERLTGKFLSEAGIMGRLATPTIKMAARGATEGAINNLAHTVSDNVIQNKPLAAEALLASGVDGALFGGIAGGILGGASAAAGAGIDALGTRASGLGSGNNSGAKVLKFLGGDANDIAKASESKAGILERAAGREKDGIDGTIHHLRDLIEKGDGSISAGVGNVNRAIGTAREGYAAGIADVTKTLQADHPNLVPTLPRISARVNAELAAMYGGTGADAVAGKVNASVQKQLRNVKTWEGWTKTREQFAAKIAGMGDNEAMAVRKGVYGTALNAIDDEMVGESSALMAANPDLAKQYAANVVGKSQAEAFGNMTRLKANNPAPSALNMHNAAATVAYGTMAGADPMVGLGIIAVKQMVTKLQQKLAAPMAEAAYRSALGAKANMATITMGNRMSNGIKTFLNGTRVGISGQHAEKESKPSYTMESYQKNLRIADELTSAAHQARVRETTDALAQQGHEEMARQMAETYGRAVAYIQHNRPKKGLDAHGAGKLGKIPRAMGLDTKDMKFQRIMNATRHGPLAIVDGLERGDISRDEVAAFQNIFPAAASDLNMRVAQEVVEYRNAGNFVPVDKIAMLGTVLNFPVDSTLEKEFVQACQDGLAANKAPPPDEGAPPPPQTDTSSYQTPLQSSV